MNGTNWSALNTFEQILVEANSYAPFWTGMLLMIWLVLVVIFLPFGTSVAFIGGSFMAFVVGLFLGYMGLVSWNILISMVGVIILIVIINAIVAKKE